MTIKKMILIVSISLIFSLALSNLVIANSLDPKVPESWFESYKLASEYDITEFDESPMLAKKVKSGDLPAVEERLPDDPPVIEPYGGNIGKYGGTANIYGTGGWVVYNLNFAAFNRLRAGRPVPGASKLIPELLKNWEFSDDYKTVTLDLRKGLKWSDGHLFTSDDYIYWWEHVANNENLQPLPPEEWDPAGLLKVEALDKYTVRYHYAAPVPTKQYDIHTYWGLSTEVLTHPAHYMKQFHIDFRDKEELMKEAKEAGFETWYDYYAYRQSKQHPERGIRPSLDMYVIEERGENYVETVRNPYCPFVDPEGNQLPYVDRVRRNLVNKEMYSLKAATGDASIVMHSLESKQIPMLKKNEEKGNFTTYIYQSGEASTTNIYFNLTNPDPQKREIYQDVRFRRALSYALNREKINDKLFFGMAEPVQWTVHKTNDFYKSEYAQKYADYNPEKAIALLDEIGLKDVNDDGFRELPSGDEFLNIFGYNNQNVPLSLIEMVVEQWKDVGLNIMLKDFGSAYNTKRENNQFDIAYHTGGSATDLMFSTGLEKYAPLEGQFLAVSPWPEWVIWYETDGEKGMEPPENIKKLHKLGKTLQNDIDPEKRAEAAHKLLELQAENLWAIGTVGYAPWPVVVKNNLKNVPKKGMMMYDQLFIEAYQPAQFYLEE